MDEYENGLLQLDVQVESCSLQNLHRSSDLVFDIKGYRLYGSSHDVDVESKQIVPSSLRATSYMIPSPAKDFSFNVSWRFCGTYDNVYIDTLTVGTTISAG